MELAPPGAAEFVICDHTIETFFSDQESRGFHIHKSHISDPQRLARLLITACLAYIFVHALYQMVLYAQITTARRQRLHRLLGECLEQGYGEQRDEVAAMLAHRFVEGQDYRRGVPYLAQAAQHPPRPCPYREAT